MTGRPTKLTPEAQARIVEALANGNTRDHAARYGGITFKTFNEWMNKGAREEGGIFRAFREAVKKAEAEAINEAVKLVRKAAREGTWQAAAWWLERRFPESYSQHRDQIRKMARDIEEINKRVAGSPETDPRSGETKAADKPNCCPPGPDPLPQ